MRYSIVPNRRTRRANEEGEHKLPFFMRIETTLARSLLGAGELVRHDGRLAQRHDGLAHVAHDYFVAG